MVNNGTEMFYECLLNGGTVNNAVDYTLLRIPSSSALWSVVIYGDGTYAIY